MGDGGDGSNVEGVGAPVVSWCGEGDEGIQRDEAKTMARRWCPGCSAPPRIARRSCAPGRWSSGVDARLAVGHEKIPHRIKSTRKFKGKRKRVIGELGVDEVHRPSSFLSAEGAELRGCA